MNNFATHKPTGHPCRIIRTDGNRAFCDFLGRANPFTWVDLLGLHKPFSPEIKEKFSQPTH